MDEEVEKEGNNKKRIKRGGGRTDEEGEKDERKSRK